MKADLTIEQKNLLHTLVQHTFAGKLKETITPIPLQEGDYAIYLKGEPSFRFKWLSDLDVLCEHGYLTFRWNRMSNGKIYSLTTTGLQALEDGVVWVPDGRLIDEGVKELWHQIQDLTTSLLDSCEAVMPAEQWADISPLIKQTPHYLETKEPQPIQLTHHIQIIGTQLLANLTNNQDLHHAQEIGHALTVLGEWSQITCKFLELLTKPISE